MDKIKVIITNKQKDIKIPTGLRMLIRRCCNAVLKMEEFQGSVEVSVTLVNNKQIREHGKYDTDPNTGAKILGDIVISMETAVEQADRFGHSLQREVGYLTAHSMLHLLGYDHEDNGLQRLRMREKEEKVMTMLGLPSSSSYVMRDEDQ